MNETDTKIARIEDRLDRSVAGAIVVQRGGSIAFRSMAEIFEFSKLMSLAQQAVPKHLRGQPGLCLGVTMQAVAWEMEPFAVAKKSYIVNDNLAYESQLIHAVIEARAPLKKRLRCTYSGEGVDRQCTVYGMFVGEDEPHEYTTPKFKDIPTKNSPLWKWDVDQQMFYLGSRAWARKWCPDVLLGVYSPDEAQYAGENAAPVQPVIHNPLEDEADAERPARDLRDHDTPQSDIGASSGAVILEGDDAERALTEPMPDDGAEFRDKAPPDHDPETGEVFDAPGTADRGEPMTSAPNEAIDNMAGVTGTPSTGLAKPVEPPKAEKAAVPRARPRPTPRQARAEPAGESKAEAAPKQAPADKTSPGANAALSIAFPQPWIRKTAADYEAYLQEWVAAWLAYGKDPDGLRNRYSAERTIRSGLGEPADHDTLNRWKTIASDVFKKLGGQS